jgi:hypothetical protein
MSSLRNAIKQKQDEEKGRKAEKEKESMTGHLTMLAMDKSQLHLRTMHKGQRIHLPNLQLIKKSKSWRVNLLSNFQWSKRILKIS